MIDPSAVVSTFAVVDESAYIGPRTVIAAGARIGAAARVGADCRIEEGAYVGYGFHGQNALTIIGDGTLVATHAVVYQSAELGPKVKIRHHAVVREHVIIGAGTSVGTGTTIEHHAAVGKDCSIHAHCHLTDFSKVGNLVFIGPFFASFSDLVLDYRRPHIHQGYVGVTIHDGARIGGRVTAMPGVDVGAEAVVGACSVIRGNLSAGMIHVGDPARAVGRVLPAHFITDKA